MTRSLTVAVMIAGASLFAGAASAAPTPCANTDISITNAANVVVNASACKGFFDGNLLNNKGSSTSAQTTQLGLLGLTWGGDFTRIFDLVDGLKGSQDVTLHKTVYGTTYLGVHYGNGKGGPGEATAFYVLNAAEGINKIHLAYSASSNLVIFATGTPPVSEAPEPASWAMMIGGFGMIGATMRRRKAAVAFA